MKKLYKSFILLFFSFAVAGVYAQNDTLLFEDFQGTWLEGDDYQLIPLVPDTDEFWVNYDEDGRPDAGTRPMEWYQSLDTEQALLFDSIPSTDSNFVISSSSWLQDLDTTNSNWLISPLIYIGDDQATLHWKSAMRQGPRYMDGYAVKIMEEDSDPEVSEITQVFRVAEMTSFGPNDPNGDSLDPNDYILSPGYVHGDGFTLTDYFMLQDSSQNAYVGILEPHSVSLADFADKWVYIAFHHDSSDDNYIDVDDILLLGTLFSSTKVEENDLRFVTYPNPVTNYLNVLFRTQSAAEVSLELFNNSGQKVSEIPLDGNYIGEYNEQFDLRHLPSGNYTVVLTLDGQVFSKNIVRK